MATDRQNLANRRNAARSTGPRTPSGKRASSANARRHGLSSSRLEPELIQELLEVISGRPLTVAQATLGDTGTRLALSLAEAEVALRRVRLAQEQIERALFPPLSAKVAAAMGQGTHDGLAQWRICLRYRAEAEARRRKALRVWLQHRNEVAMQGTGE